MPTLTVRNLPEETHRALRLRAARHGRSTEAEVRSILEETVRPASRLRVASEIRRIVMENGGPANVDFPRERSEIRGADFE